MRACVPFISQRWRHNKKAQIKLTKWLTQTKQFNWALSNGHKWLRHFTNVTHDFTSDRWIGHVLVLPTVETQSHLTTATYAHTTCQSVCLLCDLSYRRQVRHHHRQAFTHTHKHTHTRITEWQQTNSGYTDRLTSQLAYSTSSQANIHSSSSSDTFLCRVTTLQAWLFVPVFTMFQLSVSCILTASYYDNFCLLFFHYSRLGRAPKRCYGNRQKLLQCRSTKGRHGIVTHGIVTHGIVRKKSCQGNYLSSTDVCSTPVFGRIIIVSGVPCSITMKYNSK